MKKNMNDDQSSGSFIVKRNADVIATGDAFLTLVDAGLQCGQTGSIGRILPQSTPTLGQGPASWFCF